MKDQDIEDELLYDELLELSQLKVPDEGEDTTSYFLKMSKMDSQESFKSVNLSGLSLSLGNLENFNFECSDLSSSDFSGCTLSNTSFCGADLRNCNFAYTTLTNCDFTDAVTDGSDFQGVLDAPPSLYKAIYGTQERKKLKILIIDDHEKSTDGFQEVLKTYAENIRNPSVEKIDIAETYNDGIKMLSQRKYDFVLVDLNLPLEKGHLSERVLGDKILKKISNKDFSIQDFDTIKYASFTAFNAMADIDNDDISFIGNFKKEAIKDFSDMYQESFGLAH